MSDELTIEDYKAVFEDHKRLVRELDVALNGEEGAAKQASLCDIVSQVKSQRWKPVRQMEKEARMSELPQCRLDACPPGLFLFKRGDHTTLGFKSEYSTDTSSMGKTMYQCDAYVVSSGEYFWGGAATGDERHALMVTPLNMETQSDN